MELKGVYGTKFTLGGKDIGLDPSSLPEFTIVQDIDEILPTFRMRVIDEAGILSHRIAFDGKNSILGVQIGSGLISLANYNHFDFRILNRIPETTYSTSGDVLYTGILDIDDLLNIPHSRGFRRRIYSVLSDIALNELKVDAIDLSPSLDYEKLILQPMVTNAQLFNDLKYRMLGSANDVGYYIFIRVVEGKRTLVCRTYEELASQQPKYKLVLADSPVQDHTPIFEARIIDSSNLRAIEGLKIDGSFYYDYNSGTLKTVQSKIDNIASLAAYHPVNQDDPGNSLPRYYGSSNEFTSDFRGIEGGEFTKRVLNCVGLEATSWGKPNIAPGDTVEILFPDIFGNNEVGTAQHAGKWLVLRAVHSITSTFRTRLLLARGGFNPDGVTSLLKSIKRA